MTMTFTDDPAELAAFDELEDLYLDTGFWQSGVYTERWWAVVERLEAWVAPPRNRPRPMEEIAAIKREFDQMWFEYHKLRAREPRWKKPRRP